MNKLTSTVLLIALSLLTLACAFGKLTPAGWILFYAGWLFLGQQVGRRMLAEAREAPPLPERPQIAHTRQPATRHAAD